MEVRVRKQWLGCLVGGIVLFASPSAWAGHPQERQGFWIGLGGGYGSANVSCDDCDGEREGAFVGSFKLGGTLNERVLLGVESNGWIKEQEGITLTLGSLAGTVTFYPQASSGFFLKGGVGLSYIDTDFSEGSLSVSVSKTGWGVLAGMGYDLRVGRNISLTPAFNYYYGKPGDIAFEGETVFGGWSQNVVSFEIGITFH
jgi:opacity protein-like surface antigen